jgi:hypothetical protein
MSTSATVNGTVVYIGSKADEQWAANYAALQTALVGLTSTVFQFGASSGLSTSAAYLRPGMAAADSTEVFIVCPKAGKISSLYCKGTSNAAGGAVRIAVRVNGSTSALTCDVAVSGSAASDATHTVTVAAGDTLSVVASGLSGYTSGLANLTAAFAFTPS